jgi:hypothetical protein
MKANADSEGAFEIPQELQEKSRVGKGLCTRRAIRESKLYPFADANFRHHQHRIGDMDLGKRIID